MPYPTIDDDPTLGLTTSVAADTGKTVVDVRTPVRGYPLVTPEENLPEDDMHRLNHALERVDSDVEALELASLLDIPVFMLLNDRS